MCGVWSALRMMERKIGEEEIQKMMMAKKEIVMKREELKSGWIVSVGDLGGAMVRCHVMEKHQRSATGFA